MAVLAFEAIPAKELQKGLAEYIGDCVADMGLRMRPEKLRTYPRYGAMKYLILARDVNDEERGVRGAVMGFYVWTDSIPQFVYHDLVMHPSINQVAYESLLHAQAESVKRWMAAQNNIPSNKIPSVYHNYAPEGLLYVPINGATNGAAKIDEHKIMQSAREIPSLFEKQ
ncbi:hypothetical protein HYV81_02460 [Candidatus Woesearchaeota archaeon]|nr:hypothetical protein [Candidatus Woesearchaeota archaeon]